MYASANEKTKIAITQDQCNQSNKWLLRILNWLLSVCTNVHQHYHKFRLRNK